MYDDIKDHISTIMDDVAKTVPFGVGRKAKRRFDHEVFDDSDWDVYKEIGQQEHDRLKALAQEQIGTVGAGNHYVDILIYEKIEDVLVGIHYSSRGFVL